MNDPAKLLNAPHHGIPKGSQPEAPKASARLRLTTALGLASSWPLCAALSLAFTPRLTRSQPGVHLRDVAAGCVARALAWLNRPLCVLSQADHNVDIENGTGRTGRAVIGG